MFRILPLLHSYANGEKIQLYAHHTVLKIHALQGLSYHLGYIDRFHSYSLIVLIASLHTVCMLSNLLQMNPPHPIVNIIFCSKQRSSYFVFHS